MDRALSEARIAMDHGEVPVGAIITDKYGTIIGSGHNTVEAIKCHTGHAEANAIRAATMTIQSWRLTGCTLYVTLEPCMMCISLCALSRVERIIFGARSPRFGYTLDIEGVLRLYTNQIKCIIPGVRAMEAQELLENAFHEAREDR